VSLSAGTHTGRVRRPSALPAPLADRAAFSVAEARGLGVTPRRLRTGGLTAVYRGARLAVADPQTRDRVTAFATRMTERQFFSHSTAALLGGVPLPDALESDTRLHVSVMGGEPRPRVRGIVGHVLEPTRTGVLVAGGVRMTDAATTWSQLAAMLSLDDLVAAGDYILTGRAPVGGPGPYATRTMLAAAAERYRGSLGAARLREALPLIRFGPLSRRETLLRLRIVRAGLPEPRINLPVPEARHDGYVPWIDLAYPEFRVGIEYEGDHHREPDQFRKDIRRYERLGDIDWSIVRVTADDVPDGDAADASRETIERIEARLRTRGWRG